MSVRPAVALLFCLPALALAAEKPAGLAVIEKRCAACHSGQFRKSGLDVTSREALLRGGARGPALQPGDARASLLYRVAARTAQPHMPFQAAALAEEEVRAIAAWIDAGAPFPAPLAAAAKKHWAFEVPRRPPLPIARNAAWNANPVDAFLAAARERHGLEPVPEAGRRTLIRRLYLDVAGVPPTRDEVRAFEQDTSGDAWEKLVDRLLSDPRYGERWGRHWMDVWRYSDWYGWRRGNDVRNSAKFVWRWRDWIVDSLNQDKGYDRMILEMLAGDEIAPTDPQVLRATGYLARSFSKYDRHGWMQDAVDHTAMGFLGITLKCARCHDHKYDPFAQNEYYRFRAFFEPYQVRTDRVPGEVNTDKNGVARVYDAEPHAKTPLLIRGDVQNPDPDARIEPGFPAVLSAAAPQITAVSLPLESYYPDRRDFVHADLLRQARGRIEHAQAELDKATPEKRGVEAKALAAARADLLALEARIAADKAKYARPPDPRAEELAAAARKAERAAGVLKADENVARAQAELAEALAQRKDGAADEKKVGEAAKRVNQALEALKQPAEGAYTPLGTVYPESSSGRRTALARWIGSRGNPLTARVAVNHIWLRHFGKAIVPTVAEFGVNGKPPSHPELLDWLATELTNSGWSMKRIHRLILTSRAYRMRSTGGDAAGANATADPDNRFLWRMNPRRMEAETVRDSMLAVAGTLDTTRGGPELDVKEVEDSARRSIYLAHTPDIPIVFLKAFDAANPAECYQRDESVVPHQALALANSRLSRTQAAVLARRLHDAGQHDAQFVAAAFETVLGRPPTAAESAASARFLRSEKDREDLVYVLLNHNDFVTIR